jgi:hypothetical protein
MERLGPPSDCYHATFGRYPPAWVKNLQGEGRSFRDSGHCYLRFQVTAEEVSALLGSEFHSIERTEFEERTKGAALVGPRPSWWNPMSGNGPEFSASDAFHPGFSGGHAFAAYDPASGWFHLYWSGLD